MKLLLLLAAACGLALLSGNMTDPGSGGCYDICWIIPDALCGVHRICP